MGISLTGLTPATTYDALIKVGDNGPIGATLKTLSDGLGNDLPMQASTTGINFTGTVSGVASGVSGAIQFSNGSAFASDASNFFWDNTNKRLGVGTNSPSATGHFKGAGITSATSSLIAQNSAGTIFFQVLDDSAIRVQDGGLIKNFSGTGTYNLDLGRIFIRGGDSSASGALSIGTTSTAAKVVFQGSGSTSATTSLLVQNSAGTGGIKVTDDGVTAFGSTFLAVRISDEGGSYGRIRGFNGLRIMDDNFTHINMPFASNTRLPRQILIGADTTQDASSQLQIDSTTKGFLPPRMTTTQKNAIASPATGLQVFDTTMNATCEYTGTAWRVVSAGAQALAAPTNATTVDLSAGNVLSISLTSSTTFTFTGASVGTYILKLIQGGSGSYTVTWPGTVIWSGGTAPTLTTTVSKLDIITLVYDGTNYYGNYSLNY